MRILQGGVFFTLIGPRFGCGEQAIEIFSLAKFLIDDGGGIGLVDDVLFEIALVFENVTNDGAEEHDVGAGTDGHVKIGDCAGTGKARIDVYDHCAALTGLHDPAKGDGMAFRHIRAFNDDAIGVHQIAWERGCATTAK
jgi:hypothetical protein